MGRITDNELDEIFPVRNSKQPEPSSVDKLVEAAWEIYDQFGIDWPSWLSEKLKFALEAVEKERNA